MENHDPPSDYPYSRVLDEIAEAGYEGTELGPYGFLPTNPGVLTKELKRRNLTLCSAFVGMFLGDRAAHETGLAQVACTANLLSQLGCPVLILSDEITPSRLAVAGRPSEAARLSWSQENWEVALRAIRQVIDLCRSKGLQVAFHPHVGTHVETPAEVEQLLSFFPSELGLCLDTGHCLYGGGDPVAMLERYASLIRCVHLKDIDGGRLDEIRRRRLNFYDAVRAGVFVPLGQGRVDFVRVIQLLRQKGFEGWLVAEQDVLENGPSSAAPLSNAMAARRFLRTLGI